MIPWNLTDAVGHREQLGHHYSHLAGKWRRGGAPTAPSCCRRMCPRSCSNCDHQMAAKRFGERFIARGTSVTWSPRSPYLTPPVFLLWGHVKEGTYKREPRDLPELKPTVAECVRAVTAQWCRRVLVEVRRRVEICLARNGRHSDYLLLFPGRCSNGDNKRWIWISNDHGSNLSPNDVCSVLNTRAGSKRNVSVFSETPCTSTDPNRQHTAPVFSFLRPDSLLHWEQTCQPFKIYLFTICRNIHMNISERAQTLAAQDWWTQHTMGKG